MKKYIPEFIAQKYEKGQFEGSFKAYALFVDISGFTSMTQTLIGYGSEGSEVLSNIINDIFRPSIDAVYNNGGFVAMFAGDAFTALFQVDRAEYSLEAAREIVEVFQNNGRFKTKFGEFDLSVKCGLSSGEVSFGIIDGGSMKTFYFRGEPVGNCAISEQRAESMEIISDVDFFSQLTEETGLCAEFLGERWYRLSPDIFNGGMVAASSEISPDLQQKFMHPSILGLRDRGEFREIVSVFIGFEENDDFKQYIRKVMQICNAYGGYFNKVDFADKRGYILVLFGAPLAQEKLYERSFDFSLRVKEIEGFKTRIGIASGIAFAGFVGSERRIEYTALGSMVNLSARLMTRAKPWEILTDANTIKNTGESYFSNKFEISDLKGIKGTIEVCSLLSAVKIVKEIKRSTSLLGRKEEMDTLSGFIRPIYEKKFAGTIYIDGEAGIGKSRFIHQFLNSLEGCNRFVLPCDEILRKSFNPFENFFRNYFDINDGFSKQKNMDNYIKKYEDMVLSTTDKIIRDELIGLRSVLGALVGLKWEDSVYEKLDPKGKYDKTVYAIREFFIARSLSKPTVLIVEDAHWLDSDSVEVLNSLIEGVDNYPIAILILARYKDDGTEYRLLDKDSDAKRLALCHFNRETLVEMLEEMLSRKKIPQNTVDFIWEKSSGNPFFIEQMTLILVERQLLNEKYELTGEIDHIPSKINQIIVSRIDRLASDLKESIKSAAVLGMEFNENVLTELLMVSKMYERRDEIASMLREACDERIFENLSEILYVFSHNLIRDSVYDMMLKERLRFLHNLAGSIIENSVRDDDETQYEKIANHYDKAENSEKALIYLEKAASSSKQKYQNLKALELYERMLKYLDVSKDAEKLANILLNKGDILDLIGRWDEAIDVFEKARSYAGQIGDISLVIDCMCNIGWVLRNNGELREAKTLFENAYEMAEEVGSKKSLNRALGNLGTIYTDTGDYSKAIDCLNKGITICKELNDRLGYSIAILSLGNVYWYLPDLSRAAECYEEVIKISEDLDDKVGISLGSGNLGNIYLLSKDYAKSLECYQKLLSISEEIGDKLGICTSYLFLGEIQSATGNRDEALDYFYHTLEMAEELGEMLVKSMALKFIAEIYMDMGNYREALERCFECLKNVGISGYKKIESAILHLIGDIYLQMGELDNATKYFGKSLSLNREMGSKFDEFSNIIRLGFINHLKGDYRNALALYDEAIGIIRKQTEGFEKLAESLFLKAETLFCMAQPEKALAIVEEGLVAAKNNCLTEKEFKLKILKFEIENDTTSLKNMFKVENLSEKEEAKICHALWKIAGDNKYGRRAKIIYEKLYGIKPGYEIKRIMEELSF